MKLLSILVFAFSLILHSCTEPEKDDGKVFLDYRLGISKHEFDSISRNLRSQGVLGYAEYEESFAGRNKKTGYTYDFVLKDGSAAKVLLYARFEDYGMKYLDLDFVCKDRYAYTETTAFNSWCQCSVEELREVLDLYVTKYGTPERYPYLDDSWIWKKGIIDIQYSILNIGGSGNCQDSLVANGGKIQYEFTESEKLRRQTEFLNNGMTKPEDF